MENKQYTSYIYNKIEPYKTCEEVILHYKEIVKDIYKDILNFNNNTITIRLIIKSSKYNLLKMEN